MTQNNSMTIREIIIKKKRKNYKQGHDKYKHMKLIKQHLLLISSIQYN